MTRSATAARASPARNGELRVLILEDVPVEAELTARALKQAGINALVKVVDTKGSFAEELTESPPDLILSDYSLPDSTARKHCRSPGRLHQRCLSSSLPGHSGRNMRSSC